MSLENEKCVLVLDGDLPPGLAANTAAILGITLGRENPEAVGADVQDSGGRTHLGIIAYPVPVLRGDAGILAALREKLYQPEFDGLTVVDFSDLAQSCRTYPEFQSRMAEAGDLRYLGIAIRGDKKRVNRLTGNLPLL